MIKIDSRTLPFEVLNEKRREAVRLRNSGTRLADVAQLTGLSAPTIIAVHKAYLSGGWVAVAVRARGRSKDEGRLISLQQENSLLDLMLGHAPNQLELPYFLWQVEAVQALVRRRF